MDKGMLGDLDNLQEDDKIRMFAMIEQLQVRDRYLTFSNSFDASVDFFLKRNFQSFSILFDAFM